MTSTNETNPVYHALLIGIDDYQEPANQLKGCVNDIEIVEEFLREVAGEGLIDGDLRIVRLTAPIEDEQTSNGNPSPANLPNRDSIIRELRRLDSKEVNQHDKVLIYYSGHGYQWKPEWASVQHEALVTRDARVLYDVEFNALLNNIAARTTDLTVLLDCCHSESTFREVLGGGADTRDRFTTWKTTGDSRAVGDRAFPLPDADIVGPEAIGGSHPGAHMLESLDPSYIALVACRAEEKAREGKVDGGPYHGVFTHSLLKVLKQLKEGEADKLRTLRWADIWPALASNVSKTGWALGNIQHPFLIGRSERRVFGGKWVKQDAGIPISKNDDGTYTLGAGTLTGLNADALVAVYGDKPDFFSEIVSGQDDVWRWGTLRVIAAEQDTSAGRLEGASRTAELPLGARGIVVAAGTGAKLRVRLADPSPQLRSDLRSDLLDLLPPKEKNWDIEVTPRAGRGWSLSDTITTGLAEVPTGNVDALKAGLEGYYRYAAALRLVQNQGPQQNEAFEAMLLDASDPQKLAQIDPNDPQLDEVASLNGEYLFNWGQQFCIKLRNKTTDSTLHFFVLNCTGTGKVEYLGDETANAGDVRVIWRGARVRPPDPFWATTGFSDQTRDQTDRLIVVATTSKDAVLRYLEISASIQKIIDAVGTRESLTDPLSRDALSASPSSQLWSAKLIPWHIKGKQNV